MMTTQHKAARMIAAYRDGIWEGASPFELLASWSNQCVDDVHIGHDGEMYDGRKWLDDDEAERFFAWLDMQGVTIG